MFKYGNADCFRMRAWVVFLMVSAAGAGCISDEGGDPPAVPEDDPRVLTGPDCPLTFPDGSAVSCDSSDIGEPERADRPPMTEGWRCSRSWGEDGVHTELWTTPEGHVGFYWEWERWKPDGLAFQRLGFYESSEAGTVVHATYAPTGFISIPPQEPPGDVDIHNTFRQLRAWVHEADEWVFAENITYLVTGWGPESWISVRFDWPGGPYYVSLMEHDPEDDEFSAWDITDFRGFVGGREVIVDSTGDGIKYNGHDYTALRTTGVNGCGLGTNS